MYHAISFIDGSTTKNTWGDWRLIPSSRPTIAQPTPLYKYVDIPGMDGQLDITDYLVGRPTYSDRKGSFEFYVENIGYTDQYTWVNRRADIAAFFKGQKMKVQLIDDEPDYYYWGRVFFKEWRSEASQSKVILEYQFAPYRYLWNTDEEAGL